MCLSVSNDRLLVVYVILIVFILLNETTSRESTVTAFGFEASFDRKSNRIMRLNSPTAKRSSSFDLTGMLRTRTVLNSYNSRVLLPTAISWYIPKRNGNGYYFKKQQLKQYTISTKTVTTSLQLAQQDAAPAPPPKQYLLKYTYISDVLEKRGPYREKHLELARQLVSDGTCLFGGPTSLVVPSSPSSPSIPTGALFVFTTEAAAQQFVDTDPYVTNGIVTSHTIEEWNVVVSKQ